MKLFDKIRQQISTENRFSRYLLYALGEIILVVIGILLAVQVNNWYEKIKTKESELISLKNLKRELTANYDNLLKAISNQERSRDANVKLLTIYSGDHRQFKSSELDSLFAEVQWTWSFDPELSILNSIKSSGQVNTIQNPKIQSFIASYEEKVKDADEETLIVRSLIIDKYVPLVSKYISERSRAKYIGYEEIDGSKFKSDYPAIFGDREVESLLAYIYVWRREELNEERNIANMMRECIKILENELGKSSDSE
jgi:hypothetical protein